MAEKNPIVTIEMNNGDVMKAELILKLRLTQLTTLSAL